LAPLRGRALRWRQWQAEAVDLQSYNPLNDPEPFVATFLERYPEVREQLLAAEDMKFIPVLDASFEVWFKKVRRSIILQ
jgi:enoyl reductase-like protein